MDINVEPRLTLAVLSFSIVGITLIIGGILLRLINRRQNFVVLEYLRSKGLSPGQSLVTEKIYIDENDHSIESISGKSIIFYRRLVEKNYEACHSVGPLIPNERPHIEVSYSLNKGSSSGFNVSRIARVKDFGVWERIWKYRGVFMEKLIEIFSITVNSNNIMCFISLYTISFTILSVIFIWSLKLYISPRQKEKRRKRREEEKQYRLLYPNIPQKKSLD